MSAIEKATKTYGVYVLITFAVMLPLLKPGFILTLDMIFTPHLPMPDHVTSSYLFFASLHAINSFIPSDIIEKILLLGVLLIASIGMHRLIQCLEPDKKRMSWGIYAASIFFAINPFTYSRFMAGQYQVLLGYALLPWFTKTFITFGRNPSWGLTFKIGGWATLIGIVSIHTLGDLAVLSLVGMAIGLWRRRGQVTVYITRGLVVLGLFLTLSCYWLIPLVLGKGATAQTLSQFGVADTAAYATIGENMAEKIINLLRLQGFWAEGRGLFLLPQDRMVLWGTLSIAVIGLVVYGAVLLWRQRKPLALFFIASGAIGLLLAVGIGSSWLTQIGSREPHKFATLIALSYGVFLAFGVNGVLQQAAKKAEWLYAFTAMSALLIPLLLTKVMWWGFDGQLVPRQYPRDWFAVNKYITADQNEFSTLFLPWHAYMSFPFAGRIIANPGRQFFAKPTIVSNDPELDNLPATTINPQQTAVGRIVRSPQNDLAQKLAEKNIKYVLLAKSLDYEKYRLSGQTLLKLVQEGPTMQLYLNQAWRKQ